MAGDEWLSNGAEQRYWEGLRAGRLLMPQCSSCGRWQWPAVWRCGECGCWDQAWRAVSIAGSVYTWTRNWHPFAGLEGIDIPFVTVLVQLTEAGGRRLAGLLRGDEAGLRLGAPITGEIAHTSFGETTVPAIHWRLIDQELATTSTFSAKGSA